MAFEYDCAGWATKSGVKCDDGRTILKNAFRSDIKNGKVVPIVYQHDHKNPDMILGHALLENRDDGVYAYCKFNDSENGQLMKNRVHDGDVTQFSIYANRLKQTNRKEVFHGCIRELSLVLSGANPEAIIDKPYVLKHSDIYDEEFECDDGYIYAGSDYADITVEEGIIKHGFDYEDSIDDSGYNAYPFETEENSETESVIEHSDKEAADTETKTEKSEKTVGEIWDTFTDDQKKLAFVIAAMSLDGKEIKHSSDDSETSDGQTVEQVYNSLNEDQKKVLNIIVGLIIENHKERDGKSMAHAFNAFETQTEELQNESLQHSAEEIASCITEAKENGQSMRQAFLAHGIEHIDYLFTEDHTVNTPPVFIDRPQGWVSTVLNGVHHTPFSKVKTRFADITGEEARARGYIKGDKKENEVFTLLRRSVGPTTVYKHQEFDRDDVIDIVDFNVVAWVKTEMRGKLDEEIARAILVSDGRPSSSRVKIKEDCIIPIWKDDPDLFVVQARIPLKSTDDDTIKARKFIRACVKSRKNYRGSGSPMLFTTEDWLTDMLLLTDNIGRDLYEDEAKLAKKLRVSSIVTVPVMENCTRQDDGVTYTLMGIIVNLGDYTVGADKGGEVNMFDDFDIDYNKQKYLIETRCSGALTVPFSAIVIESFNDDSNTTPSTDNSEPEES